MSNPVHLTVKVNICRSQRDCLKVGPDELQGIQTRILHQMQTLAPLWMDPTTRLRGIGCSGVTIPQVGASMRFALSLSGGVLIDLWKILMKVPITKLYFLLGKRDIWLGLFPLLFWHCWKALTWNYWSGNYFITSLVTTGTVPVPSSVWIGCLCCYFIIIMLTHSIWNWNVAC